MLNEKECVKVFASEKQLDRKRTDPEVSYVSSPQELMMPAAFLGLNWTVETTVTYDETFWDPIALANRGFVKEAIHPFYGLCTEY